MSITLLILIATIGVSIICFKSKEWFYKLQFNAWQIKNRKETWRFVTHAFVHADWMHLAFNMFALYMFGNAVENAYNYYFGSKGVFFFLLLYVGGIIFAAIPSFEKNKNNAWYNSVGASGAVSAIVFTYILLDPLSKICLYGLLCFPGIIWGVVYLGYSWYASKDKRAVVNHDAHFSGAIFGIIFTIAIKPPLGLMFIEKIISYFN
ncbi:MAG: rhomboid family intramembrane serine protease [Bacteroidia bacterium]|nr:rhomboid family intramembrane serine protease [Bacteroidia bacterium]